jgi:geranylgeranyl diphosphate synthase type II
MVAIYKNNFDMVADSLTLEQIQKCILEDISNYARPQLFKDLHEPIQYLLNIGGKRMRPALVLMAAQLYDNQINPHRNIALAVEVFHNFTLMHDDIMDEAPLRRGQMTVHEKWNTNTAILSGDAMMIEAYQLLCQNNHPQLHQLLQIFNSVAIGVCEGQALDMSFEKREDVTIEEYLNMIRLKTAVLLGGALQMGGISAGAHAEDAQHLYTIGESLGIAFQLKDDYLDAFGDPEKFGKQVGGDILSDKKTFLLIELKNKMGESNWDQWNNLNWAGSDKIEIYKSAFQSHGIDAALLQACEQYSNQAIQHLDALSCKEEQKSLLRETIDSLLHRSH